MPNKPQDAEKTLFSFLTVRDLITIVSVAVSLALAWGVFSTRLALLEKEVVDRKAQTEQIQRQLDSTVRQLHDLELQLLTDRIQARQPQYDRPYTNR